MDRPLGRRAPTDWEHADKYPLTAETMPAGNVPVGIGVNWYSDFDKPTDANGNRYRQGAKPVGGAWWVGRNPRSLGFIRGGHCIALQPQGVTDATGWYDFYDQGTEGACVGFGCSRMMSLLNRKRYFARWLWDRAKERDEWPETNPGDNEGTSVRAAMDVLRLAGHVSYNKRYDKINRDGESADWGRRAYLSPFPEEGIARNRWAVNVQDALNALGTPDKDYVTILNSWGRDYPHMVRMPADTLQVLLEQDGEVAIVTDR